jgi:hypothetical protein
LTSTVDLLKASVFRDADFITLRKLEDSPGLAVFLGMLDDRQLFLAPYFDAASKVLCCLIP